MGGVGTISMSVLSRDRLFGILLLQTLCAVVVAVGKYGRTCDGLLCSREGLRGR